MVQGSEFRAWILGFTVACLWFQVEVRAKVFFSQGEGRVIPRLCKKQRKM
jgi:hypothetical protein